MANAAFAYKTGISQIELIGSKASSLGWMVPGSARAPTDLPWMRALHESETQTGTALSIKDDSNEVVTFMVNGAPVADDSGRSRGAIATFDDITKLERKSKELEETMSLLEKSRDEIRLQNDELRVLARCDSMTGAANRRSFLEKAEIEFDSAIAEGNKLCCLMVDIDHFKLVNDTHGHGVGDHVIQRVAEELMATTADRETVCRYGGEEFCLLFTNTDIEKAAAKAEQYRRTIASDGFTNVPVTASFGVSAIEGCTTLYELVNRADEALYASKDHGRNRVTRFDQIER
jgi:diguanylate cyclase (GGDEF)-like protein